MPLAIPALKTPGDLRNHTARLPRTHNARDAGTAATAATCHAAVRGGRYAFLPLPGWWRGPPNPGGACQRALSAACLCHLALAVAAIPLPARRPHRFFPRPRCLMGGVPAPPPMDAWWWRLTDAVTRAPRMLTGARLLPPFCPSLLLASHGFAALDWRHGPVPERSKRAGWEDWAGRATLAHLWRLRFKRTCGGSCSAPLINRRRVSRLLFRHAYRVVGLRSIAAPCAISCTLKPFHLPPTSYSPTPAFPRLLTPPALRSRHCGLYNRKRYVVRRVWTRNTADILWRYDNLHPVRHGCG